MILKDNGIILARDVKYVNNIFSRALGLMFNKAISKDFAMVFKLRKQTTVGVHMFFVFFAIDVIFLDDGKKVIGTGTLRPWLGHKQKRGVKYLIEMHQGKVEEYDINNGDILEFDE
ncbi:MAG: DUF192 domain-containing protein [Methanosarcinales archaeon]|nr:DUF192 domain-containing protein [Methanosarcinales archaeon]